MHQNTPFSSVLKLDALGVQLPHGSRIGEKGSKGKRNESTRSPYISLLQSLSLSETGKGMEERYIRGW